MPGRVQNEYTVLPEGKESGLQSPECVVERAAAEEQDDWLAVVEWLPTRSREDLSAIDVEIHYLSAYDLFGGAKAVFEIHFDIPDIFEPHRQPDHILGNSGCDQRIRVDT